MSDEQIIDQMIEFILKEERESQTRKMAGDSRVKNDIIEKTIKKLEEYVNEQ